MTIGMLEIYACYN